MSQKLTRNSSKSSSTTRRQASGSKTQKNSQTNTVSNYFNSKPGVPQAIEDSDDDFRSPIKLKKPPKVAWKLTKEPPKSKTSKKPVKKQAKLIKENFSSEDVNPEHLQMALALSKSEEETKEEDTPDIAAILQNVKPTSLERFGFKMKKVLEGENWKPRPPQLSKKGKNRFKYVNPILNIRTAEDQEKLISSKISLILNQIGLGVKKTEKVEIFSDRLHEFNSKECLLFKFDYASNNFYVRDLNLPSGRFKDLLRDWGTIIGREKTPEPQTDAAPAKCHESTVSSDKEKTLEPQIVGAAPPNCYERSVSPKKKKTPETQIEAAPPKYHERRSVSPDLFGSDEEDLEAPQVTFDNKDIAVQEASSSRVNDEYDPLQEGLLAEGITEVPQQEFDDIECIEISDSSEESLATPNQEHLNVTDYVKELLSKDRYSFDNASAVEPNYFTNDLSPIKDTNSSRESLNNEELNNSMNPATPLKNTNNSRESVVNNKEPNCSSSIIIIDANGSPESVLNDEELNYSTNHANNSQKFIVNNEDPSHLSPIKDTNRSHESFWNDKELNYSMNPATLINTNSRESVVDNEEPTYLSPIMHPNGGQESVLNDKELNYSTNHATPSKNANNSQEFIVIDEDSNHLSPIKNTNSSQESFLNDNELNYSMNHATPLKNTKVINNSPIMNTNGSQESVLNDELNYSANYGSPFKTANGIEEINLNDEEPDYLSPIKTPINTVKTRIVTPMLNYDEMATPLIVKELDKIGVKPLKRARGAKLLKYIYDATHPPSETDDGNPSKKARLEEDKAIIEIVGDKLMENESLIFERRQKAKVKTCKTPLQIVWHNFLCSNPEIRENILLYQPIQLETLHLMLKELGFMFHVQDLLTFLDRKCITVRVAQSQSKRHR